MDISLTKQPKKFESKFFIFTLLPVLLLAITILLGYFVIWQKYNEIPDKADQLEKLTTKQTSLDTKLKKLNNLEDFKEVVDENLSLVNKALPSEANIPILLTQVQKIAVDSGLALSTLNYSSSNNEGSINTVEIQLTAKGSYTELMTFITTLEKASRIVNVTHIRLSGSKKEAAVLSAAEVELSVGLSAPFMFVESKAVTEDPIGIDVRDRAFVETINKIKTLKVYETVVDKDNIGKDNPFNP